MLSVRLIGVLVVLSTCDRVLTLNLMLEIGGETLKLGPGSQPTFGVVLGVKNGTVESWGRLWY